MALKAITTRRSLAITQKALKADVKRLLLSQADAIGAAIINNSRFDGTIPRFRQPRIAAIAGTRIQGMFIAPDGSGPFGPNEVTALAPYPRILNKHYALGVMDVINVHNRWMKRNIPADVYLYLSNKRGRPISQADNPFLRGANESVEAHIERLDELRIFSPNPFATLDESRQWIPMHKWNTPKGYRLSDNIWEVSNRTRRDVNLMLQDGFRQGMGARPLAKKLERFLNPDAALIKTNKPYGSNAAFSAMRLARTEISRSVNHASYIAAYTNPYVDKIDVARSPVGDPSCPICQVHATLGVGGGRLRPPYDLNSAAEPPFHPHCLCVVLPLVTPNPKVVTEQLRAIIQDDLTTSYRPVNTAATPLALARDLLGDEIFRFVLQSVG